jgi:NAD(P)-dependent dehydrogenase (short-subunit alcohol dehydrogenase family)
MKELAGRTVFITGGAQGIGLGIARACAGSGMKVAIADIDEQALRAAEAELSARTETVARRLDVRDREAYAAVADEVEAALGPVALLCNNAGTGLQTPVGNMSYQSWDWVMGVNLNGVYNGLQTFLPRMISRGEPGHVVNTASGGGLVANPGFLYACSKYGVVGLSESLRGELPALGIGISVLCPGPVATNIVQNTLASAPTGVDGRRVTEGTENYFGFMQQVLATVGRPIDDVGKLVLEAVRGDQFWILTDDTAVTPLRQRTEEVTAAVPEGTFVTMTLEMINDIPTPRE